MLLTQALRVSCTAWGKSREAGDLCRCYTLTESRRCLYKQCMLLIFLHTYYFALCLSRIYRATEITHTQMFECLPEAFKA